MLKVAVVPLLFLPIFAWADCTEHLQTWAQTLHPELKFDSQRAVCKVNPGDARQVLAALPFAVNVDEDAQGDYGLDVLVADADSGKVIAHSYQDAAIVSDAVQFTNLRLDTARYQLAPGLRAFGVRISHEGSSRVNPFSSETLSLYLYDGAKLRQVMSNLLVDLSGGEWEDNCAGEFNQTKRTLVVGKPGKEGFASLRVTEESTDSHSVAKGDDCQETGGDTATSTYTLDYDGNQYPVPTGLSLQ